MIKEISSIKWRFNKKHTQIVKGVAILLMLIHHLFAFPEWIVQGDYVSMFRINNMEVEYLVGTFGKICVAIFLFLSGYGMYKITENKTVKYNNIITRAMKFLINYWIIFLIFIPIGFIFFKDIYEFNFIEFIENFCTLKSTYNPNWWFVNVYIVLLLAFPIIKIITSRPKIVHSILYIIIVHGLYYGLYIIDNIIPGFTYIQNNIIYKSLTMALAYQINFSIGCIFASYNLFEEIKLKCVKFKLDNKIIYTFIIVISAMFRYIVIDTFIYKIALENIVTVDAIVAPLIIYCAANILLDSKFESIFVVLGKNSTNMWLVHGFFSTYYFQYIVYYPKYSILIIVWLTILSLITSNLINIIYKPIIYRYEIFIDRKRKVK